jgi:hypothetical protein
MTPTSSKLNAQFNEHICQHHITSHISCSTGSMPLSNLCLHGPQRSISKRRHQKGFGKVVQMPRPMGSQASQIVTVTIVTTVTIWHILPWQAMLSSHVQRSQSTVPGRGPEVTHGSAHRWRSWQHCFCLLMSFDVFWSFDSVGLCWGYVGLQLISVSAAPSFGSNSCHSTLLDQPPQLQHVLTRQVTL